MVWLIVTTLSVISGAWLITGHLNVVSDLDRLLATGLIALTAHIAILLAAGVLLCQLNRSVVMALSLAWLLSVRLIGGARHPTIRFDSHRGHLTLTSFTAPVIIVALICVCSLVLVGLGCWVLPPFAWDEIWYHLTPVAAWYQQGAIRQLPEAALWENYNPATVHPNQLAQDLSHAYTWANVYPLNAELSALWTMVLMKSDTISEAAQFPYVLLGALSTIGLGRTVGVRRQEALMAGLLFLLTPMVLIHLRVAYVDAAFASMVTASLYLLLLWQKHLTRSYALLFGLAVGLMAGIKSTGLVFAVIYLAVALAYGLWQMRRGGLGGKELFWQAAIAGLGAVGIGAFWYLRTWWFYGNPIYPVRITLPGISLPGIGSVSQLFMKHNTPPIYLERNPIINLLTSWLELGDESYNYYSRTRGLGPVWGALALPAMIPFAVDAWKGRHAERLWMLGLTVALLLIQPAAWWPRYVLYVVPVGLVALAWLLERLRGRMRRAVVTLLLIHLLVSTSLVLVETLDKLPAALPLQREQRTFGQLYFDDYRWVDRLPATDIGHTPLAWIYPLYGGLRHKVALVDAGSREAWRQAIMASRVDYMVVNNHFGDYHQWTKDLIDLLVPYQEGDELSVYRVKR